MSTTMQRLSGSISSPSVLTGRLGIAFMPAPTGDATALVTDILAPKTAYIATGKVVGTCTFDADTSDGTATEGDIRTGTSAYVDGVKLDGSLTPLDTSSATATASDILTGKTAYISDGTEATGTCDFNADTTDATATADSLLYGHTAYGAAGTKLTGTGAYWQYVRGLSSVFVSSSIPGDVVIRVPNANIGSQSFADCTELTKLDITFSACSSMYRNWHNCTNLTEIILHGSTSSATDWRNVFSDCSKLTIIGGDPLNMSSMNQTTTSIFNAIILEEIRIVASTVKISLSFQNCPLLSTTSLLSIANGIGAAITLTLHATSKTNCDNILVDNVGGVAVLGSAMTLSAFITGVKGATIA